MLGRIVLFALSAIALAFIFFLLMRAKADEIGSFEKTTIKIDKATFLVYVADTYQKRSQGLMNVTGLPLGKGMIFVFPRQAPVTFYNKNTLIPLDIVWIKEGEVQGFASLPSIGRRITYLQSPYPVDSVLELPRGSIKRYNLAIGDALLFPKR